MLPGVLVFLCDVSQQTLVQPPATPVRAPSAAGLLHISGGHRQSSVVVQWTSFSDTAGTVRHCRANRIAARSRRFTPVGFPPVVRIGGDWRVIRLWAKARDSTGVDDGSWVSFSSWRHCQRVLPLN
jgi:hypothetical protein